MSYGVKLRTWGEYACFSRPEFSEKVSYDVITPTAARGILEAIHWKPAINWVVDKITVLKPLQHYYMLTNGINSKIKKSTIVKAMSGKEVNISIDISKSKNHTQTGALLLKDVEYVIEAHFDMTKKSGERDSKEKHYAQFMEKARGGQCFSQPYFGMREFAAQFELIEGNTPKSPLIGTVDLGWMLLNIDYDSKNKKPSFFHAIMRNGVIDVKEGAIQ